MPLLKRDNKKHLKDLDTKNMIIFEHQQDCAEEESLANVLEEAPKEARQNMKMFWYSSSDIISSVSKNSVGISNVSLAICQFLHFLPQNIALKVYLSGYPTVAGRYLLQPELKNGRPVYRGVTGQGAMLYSKIP